MTAGRTTLGSHVLALASRVGVREGDNDEVRLLKTMLVLSTVSLSTLGWVWGGIYLYYGEVVAAIIPWVYALMSYVSTAIFALTGRYKLFRMSQLGIAIFLPFFLGLALGGFAPSSAVILWSLISPLGGLLFGDRRYAVRLFVLFLGLLLTSFVVEPQLAGTNSLPPFLVALLFVMNLGGTSAVGFMLVYYFTTEKEQAFRRLRDTQAQLLHAEKMASLGQLTAGIAHEIKNPLNFVNNFSQLNIELTADAKALVTDISTDSRGSYIELSETLDELSANARRVLEHGRRADSVVTRMMEHAQAAGSEAHPTEINRLVEEYANLVFHSFMAEHDDGAAQLALSLDPAITTHTVRSKELGSVVQNLVGNALDACLGHPSDDRKILIATRMTGQTIEIEVSDNGPGVPPDIRDRIFEPFFTTKPTGQGTGLGLSLAYETTASALEGQLILAESRLGGATFVIRLPIKGGGEAI